MSRVIIGAPNGGMGDRAPASTSAERFVKERGDEVWWYDNFRNDGVREFWLRENPYVIGVTKEPSTHCISLDNRHRALLAKHMSNVAAHEEFFGFPPPYNTAPRIYWTPQDDPRFHGKVLVDPSGITTPFTKEAFEPFLNALLVWSLFRKEDMILLEPPSQATASHAPAKVPADIFPDIPRFRPADIIEQAGAIASCTIFATNESGGAAMAVAIRAKLGGPRIVATITTRSMNLLEWRWQGVDYFVTSKLTPDW